MTQFQQQVLITSAEGKSFCYKDEAIPLITVEKDKRFTVNPEALEMIQSLNGDLPLAIVAVAGMYRTGKSYLLNRVLLDRSDGFGVGPSINPCTKGLWIWGRPVEGTTSEGESVQVLVIDTEGLGAFDETQNHDARVFSLALLLSSSFVYNSMGTIDENALQQLSLVVNLTNHIQSKSHTDELAAIFPTFTWIVRDFALRLEDQNQQPITQHEYFERSLVEQKGESESVKAKNQIRAHIKKYFTVRDCCTMVRPLANEKQLQILARLGIDDLRPEFVEQLREVRRKILFRIKPKELNGRMLSGPMLAQLACTYVEAINCGQIPNIEHAWSFISKQECQKALEQSLANFEAYLSRAELPIADCEALIDQSHQAVTNEFAERVRGMETDDFQQKLQSGLQKIAVIFRERNLNQFHREFKAFASVKAAKIKNALQQGTVDSFSQVEELLEELKQQLINEAPAGPQTERAISIERFVSAQLAVSCQIFITKKANEHQLQAQKAQATIEGLEEDKQDLRAREIETRERMQAAINQLQSDLMVATTKLSLVSTQYEAFKTEQEQLIARITQTHNDQIRSLQALADSLGSELDQKEQVLGEAQKSIQALKSELDKSQALNSQKCQFLELQLSQKTQSEKNLLVDQQVMLTKHQESIRDLCNDYERRLSQLRAQKEDAEDKLSDTAAQLASTAQVLSESRSASEETERLLKAEVSNLKSELLRSVDQVEVERKQEQLNQLQQSFDELKQSIKVHIAQHAIELLRTRDERDQSIARFEKEVAILRQSIEFKDATIKELGRGLEEKTRVAKRNAKQVEELQASLTQQEQKNSKEMEELRKEEALNTARLRKEIDEIKAQANQEIQNALQQQRQAQKESAEQVQLREREISQLQSSLESLTRDKQRVEEQLKTQAERRLLEIQEITAESDSKLAELARELQEVSEANESQVQRLQQQAEESLGHLRVFFDSEKERILARSLDEKNSLKKQLSDVQTELSQANAEIHRREDEASQLEEELQACQNALQQTQTRFELFAASQAQKMEALTAQLRDRETKLQFEQENNTREKTETEERHLQVTTQIQLKLDQTSQELTFKTKEAAELAAQCTTFAQKLEDQIHICGQQSDELVSSKSDFEIKQAALKVTIRELEEAALNVKLEGSREMALLSQKNSFLESSVAELRNQLSVQTTKFDEQVQSLKQEAMRAYEEHTVRFADQKRSLERKHEEKLRRLKEMTLTQKRQITELENELCLAEERLANEQTINQSQLERVAYEVSQLKQQQTFEQETLLEEKKALISELEQTKAKADTMEKTNLDLVSQLERERMLHEGKVKFVEQQRDQAKQDLAEQTRKFEFTVEQVRKRAQGERERQESEQASVQSGLEKKLKSQQDRNAELTARLESMSAQLQLAEEESRTASAKLQNIERDLLSSQRTTDKKSNELTEREAQMQIDVQNLTERYESRILEAQAQLASEKESFRKKLLETEQRSKELELRRAALLFDFEKERAQTNAESERMRARNCELQELLEKVERKNAALVREVEKLRNSQKSQKQFVTPNGSLTQRTLSATGSSGALTSRTEVPRTASTIKVQFGKTRLSIAHNNAFKENQVSECSVDTSVAIEEKKAVDKPPVRSSLLSVTAPFRQRGDNEIAGGPQMRPALIKKLNLPARMLEKREELTDSRSNFM